MFKSSIMALRRCCGRCHEKNGRADNRTTTPLSDTDCELPCRRSFQPAFRECFRESHDCRFCDTPISLVNFGKVSIRVPKPKAGSVGNSVCPLTDARRPILSVGAMRRTITRRTITRRTITHWQIEQIWGHSISIRKQDDRLNRPGRRYG